MVKNNRSRSLESYLMIDNFTDAVFPCRYSRLATGKAKILYKNQGPRPFPGTFLYPPRCRWSLIKNCVIGDDEKYVINNSESDPAQNGKLIQSSS
jgi:hypothetical protein